MKILAVDTTWDNMVVALYSDNKIYSEVSDEGAKKHNSSILPMIDRLLGRANVKINEIDYFSAVVGPGSFTGIRIGVSTVNALAFASGGKKIAINALEELAYPCNDDEFYTAIDCRHNCYYYAKFNGSFENMENMGEISAEELDNVGCKVIKKTSPSDPDSLIAICKSKIERNELGALAPLYLKKSQAEREFDAKNKDKVHFENLSIEFCNQVFDIESQSIEEPWSLEQIKGLATDKNAVARVGIVGGKVICYYSFYNIYNEGNINNLAVREDFRGKGVGKLLLEDMIKVAKEKKISALTLEVSEKNTVAIGLYSKFGFVIEGKRTKFYSGIDDALIMWNRNI